MSEKTRKADAPITQEKEAQPAALSDTEVQRLKKIITAKQQAFPNPWPRARRG